jgi:hypothetical protein
MARYNLLVAVTQEEALGALEEAIERIDDLGFYVAIHGRDGRWSPAMAFEILSDLYKSVTGEPWPGADK